MWVRLGVPQVAEGYGGCRTVSSENIEEVEEQGIFDVTHVLCPRLLEGGTVDDPSLAYEEDVSVGAVRGADRKLTNGNSTKSLRP